MAEQLGLEKRRSQSAAINYYERTVSPAASAVDFMGDELFARAALTPDQDGELRAGDPVDIPENVLHAGAAPYERAEPEQRADDPVVSGSYQARSFPRHLPAKQSPGKNTGQIIRNHQKRTSGASRYPRFLQTSRGDPEPAPLSQKPDKLVFILDRYDIDDSRILQCKSRIAPSVAGMEKQTPRFHMIPPLHGRGARE